MDVEGEVLLQLFNKSKFRHGTKSFLQPKFLSFVFIVKFKKLGFSASLIYCMTCHVIRSDYVLRLEKSKSLFLF